MHYSQFFCTLHDEQHPVGTLGRGAHCSVLRAVLWEPKPRFHDFAIIWDEDHDARVIWIAEQLYARGLLAPVLALGERKGSVTVLIDGALPPRFNEQLEEIAQNPPSDCFSSYVERFDRASSLIIQDEEPRLRAYLGGLRALFVLGAKPLEFSVAPFARDCEV